MKKYTIIFVIFVMFSKMSYGQKQPKLLWEKEFDQIDGKVLYNYGESSSYLRVSPKGNICAFAFAETNVFDKDGNLMWKANDFGESISRNLTDTELNWIWTKDSAYFFNKDYQFIKKMSTNYRQTGGYYNISKIEDGILIFKNDTIFKYDFNLKEIWRYKHTEFAQLGSSQHIYFNKDAPYQFTSEIRNTNTGVPIKYNNLILDETGKKILQFYSEKEVSMIHTPDKGFWIVSYTFPYLPNSNEFFIKDFNIKGYDFQGNQRASASASDVGTSLDLKYYSPLISQENSFVLPYINRNGKEIFFAKIEKNGSIKKTSKIRSKNIASEISQFSIRMISENEYMFSVVDTVSAFFGVINFNNKDLGWTAELPKKQIELTKDNFRINGVKPNDLYAYNIDGTININFKDTDSTFQNAIQYGRVQDANNEYFSIKTRIRDGKVIWKIPFGELLFDEKGNEYIRYTAQNVTYKGNSRVDFISKYKNVPSKFYQFPNPDLNYYGGTGININFKDKTLITIPLEPKGNNAYKFILRKYSTQDSYDSSTRCAEKLVLQIQTDDKPEDCPSVKVKLSNPKREGINYQWQKDGKDLSDKVSDAYNFNESGNYTVVAKDSICQNSVISNVIKVTINPNPTAEIKASKNAICEGEKVSINAVSSSKVYQWQKDQKDIPDATKAIYETTLAGTYRVIVSNENCPKLGYSNTVNLVVKPTPESIISTDTKGVVYEPFTVKMTANSGTGLAYQWLKDDAIIPNETKATYEAQKSGKYKVNVTYDGCTKLSDALTISILIPLANQEEIGEEQVQVYPNPSKGEFKIILPKSLKSADIQLFDTFGRERSLVYVGEQAQAEGLTQGIYFLRIQKGERNVTNKILIE